MTSKRILIDGCDLHYLCQGETGPAIVLIHGNSCSSACWKNQFGGILKEKYRLYALDLPGHGLSEKSRSPQVTYTLQGMAHVVSRFIETLTLDSCFLVGHSLGGHIALQTLALSKHISGLLIAGAPPLTQPPAMDKAFFANPNMVYGFTPELTADQAALLAAEFFNGPAPQRAVDDILATDTNFRKYFGETLSTFRGFEDETIILSTSKVPRCILQAENDKLVQGGYIEKLGIDRLYQNKIHWFANTSHMIMQDHHPEQFDKKLDEFITSPI